jgi:hypothetical protein
LTLSLRKILSGLDSRVRPLCIAHPPFRGYADPAVDFPGDRARRHAIRFEPRPVVRHCRAHQAFRIGAFFAGATRTEPILQNDLSPLSRDLPHKI